MTSHKKSSQAIVPKGFKTTSAYLDTVQESVIESLESGVSIRDLARAHSVGTTALYSWLSGNPDRAERYAAIRRALAADIVDQGLAELDAATPETISVAREKARYAQWLAERMDRQQWGAGPGVAVQVNVDSFGAALRELQRSNG